MLEEFLTEWVGGPMASAVGFVLVIWFAVILIGGTFTLWAIIAAALNMLDDDDAEADATQRKPTSSKE